MSTGPVNCVEGGDDTTQRKQDAERIRRLFCNLLLERVRVKVRVPIKGKLYTDFRLLR